MVAVGQSCRRLDRAPEARDAAQWEAEAARAEATRIKTAI